jgi:hypothetical protein
MPCERDLASKMPQAGERIGFTVHPDQTHQFSRGLGHRPSRSDQALAGRTAWLLSAQSDRWSIQIVPAPRLGRMAIGLGADLAPRSP